MIVHYGEGIDCAYRVNGEPDNLAITNDEEFRLCIWEQDGKLHICPNEEIVLVPADLPGDEMA